MKKQGCWYTLSCLGMLLLSGCLGPSSVWTGAKLAYDRHGAYKKLDDYQLASQTNHALFSDLQLKCRSCYLDVAVFNGDILVAGHVPTSDLMDLVHHRLAKVHGYRDLFKQVSLRANSKHTFSDSWITAKVRSQMFKNAEIDPNIFKIITIDGIVYVMGNVPEEEANLVLAAASQTTGVVRVVKLMRYYKMVRA